MFIQLFHEWGFEEDTEKEISELTLLDICSLAWEVTVMFLNIKAKSQKIKSIHNLNFCFQNRSLNCILHIIKNVMGRHNIVGGKCDNSAVFFFNEL